MEPNIINLIIAKKKGFVENNKNKQSPAKLYLTLSDELELSALPSEQIGDSLASLFSKYGSREVLKRKGNKFYEMEVVWDSDKFKVE